MEKWAKHSSFEYMEKWESSMAEELHLQELGSLETCRPLGVNKRAKQPKDLS